MATFTDSFTAADNPSLAAAGTDLTWTDVQNAWRVAGNQLGLAAFGAVTYDRAEHDVGSADMYAEADLVTKIASGDPAQFAVLARYSASANTCYMVCRGMDAVDDITIRKTEAGGRTNIAFATVATSLPEKIRIEVEGTTIRGLINGTVVVTATDTAITTGQRGGLYGYLPVGGIVQVDNFATGSLSAPAGTTGAVAGALPSVASLGGTSAATVSTTGTTAAELPTLGAAGGQWAADTIATGGIAGGLPAMPAPTGTLAGSLASGAEFAGLITNLPTLGGILTGAATTGGALGGALPSVGAPTGQLVGNVRVPGALTGEVPALVAPVGSLAATLLADGLLGEALPPLATLGGQLDAQVGPGSSLSGTLPPLPVPSGQFAGAVGSNGAFAGGLFLLAELGGQVAGTATTDGSLAGSLPGMGTPDGPLIGSVAATGDVSSVLPTLLSLSGVILADTSGSGGYFLGVMPNLPNVGGAISGAVRTEGTAGGAMAPLPALSGVLLGGIAAGAVLDMVLPTLGQLAGSFSESFIGLYDYSGYRGSVLDRGRDLVVVYPEEGYTDTDGNTMVRASSTGITTEATIQFAAASGTSARRAEQDNEGYETEQVYNIRFPRSFTQVVGAQSKILWRDMLFSVFGDVHIYNASARTAHTWYSMRRT